jgi:hypothetical protein
MLPQAIDYKQLAEQVVLQAATKAVSSTPSATYGHGPEALYSSPGLDQQVFNAMILPHLGVQGKIPFRTTNVTDPNYGILTGVTATSGSNPTGECDDPKIAGLAKLCQQSAPLGRYSLQTKVYSIEHFGEQTNRGEFLDLNLIGAPFQNTGVPTSPGGQTAQSALRTETGKAMFEFAASWGREFAKQFYNGSPSNNTANGGYKEPNGLETLVNTGYRDAETGVACPAADSIVEDFSNANITTASADIVGLIQDIFFRLRHIGARAGLGRIKWCMSMPYGMFYRLSEVWAYYYQSRALDALTFNSEFEVNIDGTYATNTRDSYRGNLETRTGQFLMVDGQRIDVILDDAIPETEVNPGQFAGDIYILPLTVLGGTPVLYREFFNFNSPNGAREGSQLFAPGDTYYTTDGGAYLWHKKPPTNYCVQLMTLERSRTVLRTPYIAARIQNVLWSPITEHERSPFTDSDYFVNGGKTDRAGYGPSFFSPTS